MRSFFPPYLRDHDLRRALTEKAFRELLRSRRDLVRIGLAALAAGAAVGAVSAFGPQSYHRPLLWLIGIAAGYVVGRHMRGVFLGARRTVMLSQQRFCRQCGYDLQGSTTRVCPECGGSLNIDGHQPNAS